MTYMFLSTKIINNRKIEALKSVSNEDLLFLFLNSGTNDIESLVIIIHPIGDCIVNKQRGKQ